MTKICFKTPNLEELSYKQKMLADPETMSYNAGWDCNANIDNYNYETGCIDFDESRWAEWHKNWADNKFRFYAYIYNSETPVGDVAFRYNDEESKYDTHIIIEAKHRGKSYAKQAVKLLIDKAFNEYNVNSLIDDVEETRQGMQELFGGAGFKITKRYEGSRFGKPVPIIRYELKKEDYEK